MLWTYPSDWKVACNRKRAPLATAWQDRSIGLRCAHSLWASFDRARRWYDCTKSARPWPSSTRNPKEPGSLLVSWMVFPGHLWKRRQTKRFCVPHRRTFAAGCSWVAGCARMKGCALRMVSLLKESQVQLKFSSAPWLVPLDSNSTWWGCLYAHGFTQFNNMGYRFEYWCILSYHYAGEPGSPLIHRQISLIRALAVVSCQVLVGRISKFSWSASFACQLTIKGKKLVQNGTFRRVWNTYGTTRCISHARPPCPWTSFASISWEAETRRYGHQSRNMICATKSFKIQFNFDSCTLIYLGTDKRV